MFPQINLQILIWKEEEMYIAKSPLLGVISQGQTIKEALENVKEAVELYIEDPDVQVRIYPLFQKGLPAINICISPAQEDMARSLFLNEQITSPFRG